MGLRKISTGTVVTLVIALLPIPLWLLFTPNQNDALIRLSALSGLSLLAWNIILSARLKLFDKLFFGLDRMYRVHQQIAGWVVILISFHFTFLVLKYAQLSLISGYEFIKPDLNIAYWAGRIGFAILVALTLWTMYFRIQYRWFVLAMRILGAVIFLAGYHALFVPGSDVKQNLGLLIYTGSLTTIAGLVYIYRSLFHRRVTTSTPYEIVSIDVKENISDIKLKPLGRPIRRYAGQFAFVRFADRQIHDEEHPFTISAGSDDESLRFCIKGLGDFTNYVQNLKPGTKALVDAPYGNFSFTKTPSARQVWIAGGIGITPFLSMAASLPENKYEIDLYYSVKTKSEAIFLRELQQIASQNNKFRVFSVNTAIDGVLTADKILSNSPKEAYFLLCGPVTMMKSLKKQLISAGVPRNQINYEEFSLS